MCNLPFRLFVCAAVSLACLVVDSFFFFFFCRQDEFEMQADAIAPGQTVVVVDDIIATGGQFFSRLLPDTMAHDGSF